MIDSTVPVPPPPPIVLGRLGWTGPFGGAPARNCWVLRRADGTAWDAERDPHFDTEADALLELTDHTLDHGLTRTAGVRAVRLGWVCARMSCDSCDDALGDDDLGFATLHFADQADAAGHALHGQGWTTDGRRWHCAGCESLSDPDQDEGPIPLCAGQEPLPGMTIAEGTSWA